MLVTFTIYVVTNPMHYLPLASLMPSWQSGTTSVGLHYGQPGLEMHSIY